MQRPIVMFQEIIDDKAKGKRYISHTISPDANTPNTFHRIMLLKIFVNLNQTSLEHDIANLLL